ncbi:alpha/beta fold hydrolase [uncultured Sulfitobacter sp.]|uniref:alpha/beta hydrolase family protein n=1 Tax=uncultured Sulfitobacter sp. TaxID=191468 RepID=UPI00262C67AD|nr:alpha/beta fold hydrolase [uncultured Sulfitobacter sp.]
MTRTRIDRIGPYAPALALRGPYPVGVRTHQIILQDQPDVHAPAPAGATRPLTVEIWYPAAADTAPGGTYDTLLRDGVRRVTLAGQAVRDAAPAHDIHAPLIIISHGYPGNRYLLVHLAESLAAKGYVVTAPDHAGSTYEAQDSFGLTLLHRPLDQIGVVDAMAKLDGDLGDMIDADRTGIIGYSMGGYGALISGGAGLAPAAPDFARAPPERLLDRYLAGSDSLASSMDQRIKAILPIGPWGGLYGMWDAAGLAGLRVPALIIAGTADDVSGYAAMREIFEGITGVERHLLSMINGGHNAAAPYPAPEESWTQSDTLGWPPYLHHADPVWDSVVMNNIAQHFAAAFFGVHLRGDTRLRRYLDGTKMEGFSDGTAQGLRLESLGI